PGGFESDRRHQLQRRDRHDVQRVVGPREPVRRAELPRGLGAGRAPRMRPGLLPGRGMWLVLSPARLDESDERSFNSDMGRISGVTAAETRERLLRAAADVFAERGYEGTRVADIATAAGVSNGAMYAHFASKAELLVDALRTHGRRLLADLLAADPNRSVTDVLLAVGSALVPPDLHAVGDDEWAALLSRVVTGLSPAGITVQTGTTQ